MKIIDSIIEESGGYRGRLQLYFDDALLFTLTAASSRASRDAAERDTREMMEKVFLSAGPAPGVMQ